MKKTILSLIILLSIVTIASAAPLIYGNLNNGNWTSNGTWSLNRTPQNGDTVIIAVGKTIVVSSNINLTSDNIHIKVFGILKFTNGKLRLGPNSTVEVMTGASIISLGSSSADKLEIGGVVKFNGTETIVTGPILATATTGVSPTGFRSVGTGTLPVKLIGFNVARQQNNLIIEWSTAQEFNSDYFEVQRSDNGINWTSIATVNAAGNSTSVKKYSYTDYANAASKVYYRLKQVDIDGRFDLSAVRMINNQTIAGDVKISNGFANNVFIHFSSQLKGNVSVQVISLEGHRVNQRSLSNPIGQQILSVNQNLKGVYVVAVIDENGNKFTSQILL